MATSYSVGGECFCNLTALENGVARTVMETTLGWQYVQDVCALIPGPGLDQAEALYNDVQCGNGPPDSSGAEHKCPGRVDIANGCGHIGPKWNLTGLTTNTTAVNTNTNTRDDETVVLNVAAGAGVQPRPNWADSYSVGDRCYCNFSTYDHGMETFMVETPLGWKTMPEVCQLLGDGPGMEGRPLYNDLQCGNGPPNDASDEHVCPGRVDGRRRACGRIGPRWNFEGVVDTTTEAPVSPPAIPPVSNPTSLPVSDPTVTPVMDPSQTPSVNPTQIPSLPPSEAPTGMPSTDPTDMPSSDPTLLPVSDSSDAPVTDPTLAPLSDPTTAPAPTPTTLPVSNPMVAPEKPSMIPVLSPVASESASPTEAPSAAFVTETFQPTLYPGANVTLETNATLSNFTTNSTEDMFNATMMPNATAIPANETNATAAPSLEDAMNSTGEPTVESDDITTTARSQSSPGYSEVLYTMILQAIVAAFLS